MASKCSSQSGQPRPPASYYEEKENDLTESEEESEEEEEESEEELQQQLKQPVKHKKPEPQDDEEESEDEEEESDEEEEEEEGPQPPCISTPRFQSEADESEEESDSERTEQSPSASSFFVKPIVSKPMDDSSKSQKPTSKPPVSATPTKTGVKRVAEAEPNLKDSRNKKSKVDEENGVVEEKKSPAVNRLWSLDDEIAILEGIIEYRSKKGTDPNADMAAFFEFIKESLHVHVSKNQLADKIRRLKKKYQKNSQKSENGEDPVFSNPHDVKSYDLSKTIWGCRSSNGADENVKISLKKARKSDKVNSFEVSEKDDGNNKAKTSDKVVALEKEDGRRILPKELVKDEVTDRLEKFWSTYPRLSQSFEMENSSHLAMSVCARNIMKEALSSIGSSKAKQLEEKWKNLLVAEAEVYKKRLDLILEQTRLVLDKLKSSES